MDAMDGLLVGTREDIIENRLAERDHQRLGDREDDHRSEGQDGPGLVMREVAVEAAQHAHGRSALIIASAARLLAPAPPSFFRTSANSFRTSSRCPSSVRTSDAIRAPLTSCCRSSGTIRFPAMMFTRLKFGSFTRRRASQCVA